MTIKELYKREGSTDYAAITKSENKFNPYEVELKISFADYESARTFIESTAIGTVFKQVIKED